MWYKYICSRLCVLVLWERVLSKVFKLHVKEFDQTTSPPLASDVSLNISPLPVDLILVF